ncbi:MAG: hypothetical protein FWF85_07955 [Clostridiales bacterium]|nr:hypothetical protein [Clostridiales bacterium]MCL1874035.1 hypothetical protein [Clostridiales bacterium]
MKPMLYATPKGFAEVTGYGDGYKVEYDSKTIPTEILKDDGDFASWVFKNRAHFMGNYRKGEKLAAK